jgi:general secretion pathway protein N
MSVPRLFLLFLAGLALALPATMPLSVAMAWAGAADRGFSAKAVQGSIWNGRLQSVSYRGMALGDAGARLDPRSLLTLSPRLDLTGARGTATLRLTGDGVELAGLASAP